MGYSKKINVTLWAAQWFFGLFFALASGAPKLAMPFLPADAIPMPIPLPLWFVLFIGVLEIAGGLGLILPGIFHIRTTLTPWAAVGLALVTEGATVYNLAAGSTGSAAFAVVVGLIMLSIAYARWRVAPLRASSQPRQMVVLGTAK